MHLKNKCIQISVHYIYCSLYCILHESGSSSASLHFGLVLLTVYIAHSFCTTVLTGHDHSAPSDADFTFSMSHPNVLIWCFAEGEDHAQVVMSGCMIQSGERLFNCGVSAVPNFCPAGFQQSTQHVIFIVRLILWKVCSVNKD